MKWTGVLVFLLIGSMSLPLDVQAQVPGLTPAQKAFLDQQYAKSKVGAIDGSWLSDGSVNYTKLSGIIPYDRIEEVDPIFVAHAAYGIELTDISTWDSYGPRITVNEADIAAAESDIDDLETSMDTWTDSFLYTNRASITKWSDLQDTHYAKFSKVSSTWQVITAGAGATRIENLQYDSGKTDMWEAAAYAVTNLTVGDIYMVNFYARLISASPAYATVQLKEAGVGTIYTPTLFSGPVDTSVRSFHSTVVVEGPGSTKLDLYLTALTDDVEIRGPIWTVTWLGNYR